jgi:hypothetical protein
MLAAIAVADYKPLRARANKSCRDKDMDPKGMLDVLLVQADLPVAPLI